MSRTAILVVALAALCSAPMACRDRRPSPAPLPSASASASGLARTPPRPIEVDPDSTLRVPDVEYVGTPDNVVDKMLEVADIRASDVIYDLGSGDGRIIIRAAKKYGSRGVGYELASSLVNFSREEASRQGVGHLVRIEQQDLFTADLSKATVVVLYLMPWLNLRLLPQMQRLKPGSRVVSHDFDLGGIPPAGIWTVQAPDHRDAWRMRDHFVYLWKAPIPLRVTSGGQSGM